MNHPFKWHPEPSSEQEARALVKAYRESYPAVPNLPLKKFYVSWFQDGGYGAVSWCHAIIEAPTKQIARRDWFHLVRETGIAAATYSSRQNYRQLFVVEEDWQKSPNKEILDHYRDLE